MGMPALKPEEKKAERKMMLLPVHTPDCPASTESTLRSSHEPEVSPAVSSFAISSPDLVVDPHAHALDEGLRLSVTGAFEAALTPLATAWLTLSTGPEQNLALRLSAEAHLACNRAHDALVWVKLLTEHDPTTASWLSSLIFLCHSRPERALCALDRAGKKNNAQGENALCAQVAHLLMANQIDTPAARATLATLVDVIVTTDVFTPPEAIQHASFAAWHPLGARLTFTLLCGHLAQRFMEERTDPREPASFALALAPLLPLPELARWAVLIRGAGMEDACPLIERAFSERLPLPERIAAAATAVLLFADPLAETELTANIDEADRNGRAAAADILARCCPDALIYLPVEHLSETQFSESHPEKEPSPKMHSPKDHSLQSRVRHEERTRE